MSDHESDTNPTNPFDPTDAPGALNTLDVRDVLTLADAVASVVRAAEAMADAGDLLLGQDAVRDAIARGSLTPEQKRRDHLYTTVRTLQLIRQARLDASNQQDQRQTEEEPDA